MPWENPTNGYKINKKLGVFDVENCLVEKFMSKI